ncbi:MAG: LEA type 2 family protein [Ignavibacteriae bacterium]|nr:LEA type 2 family protein [Ignavibacteriota bacterium]MCB9216154.1 LEA type 2 family protein [Ignavibacteria bacterium]
MKRMKTAGVLSALTALLFLSGCQTLKDAAGALGSLKQLQFKLGDVDNFKAAGIDISKLSSPSSFSLTDAAKALSAYQSKKLPVSFTLNVLAKNPNTGTSTTKGTDLLLKKLEWTLYIDGKETINGIAGNGLRIPGTGETTTIPLSMSLDLLEFFGNKGYEDLMNLAFAIGGVSGSSSRLTLKGFVTVNTPLGDVKYPDELTIVNASFTN